MNDLSSGPLELQPRPVRAGVGQQRGGVCLQLDAVIAATAAAGPAGCCGRTVDIPKTHPTPHRVVATIVANVLWNNVIHRGRRITAGGCGPPNALWRNSPQTQGRPDTQEDGLRAL